LFSNGSLAKFISFVPRKSEGSMVVLYDCQATKVKDVDKLAPTFNILKKRGLDIQLHIAAVKWMDLLDYVQLGSYDRSSFVKEMLSKYYSAVIILMVYYSLMLAREL
jgi:glycosyltransferase involved in cell wall biosynthesis